MGMTRKTARASPSVARMAQRPGNSRSHYRFASTFSDTRNVGIKRAGRGKTVAIMKFYRGDGFYFAPLRKRADSPLESLENIEYRPMHAARPQLEAFP
jgi:hypothetical protein